ncbi:hypothetical protein CMUS01_05815 [Colletotrichum musicola]|uniref:Uncharacterized protein n=1 Tax=Colletotrichum musicola TaxID=2175873 RepID=A0A8H6KPL9_9PEZI|nr:hypothetical protein CMUS01_05815 [Colletotrichum musicola]
MVEITIGYVAGAIAAAIVVAQIWCPTAIALILAGLLRDTETAATWNIASRVLQRTWWPTILQSDSVLTRGARLRITLVSWSVPIIAVLIAITGVVTPLGLYEEMDTLDTKLGTFTYVKDTGSFGAGTSPRRLYNFSRTCSWGHGVLQGPAPCPYSGNSVIVTGSNGTFNFTMPNGYTSRIDPIAREVFSSGTKGRTTVSNFWDIEWRQVTTKAFKYVDNGTDIPVGAYRQLESHITDPSIKVVEGLVVDARDGGIGLRNHTLPSHATEGASWSEHLLFIEPIASCVDTNLTLDFEVTLNLSISTSGVANLRLTDRGGFVNIDRTYPSYDHDNAQSNPDLAARAYKAAYLNNAWTMMYLNVTTGNNDTTGASAWSYLDSSLGKEFPLQDKATTNYRALGFDDEFGNYLDLLGGGITKNKAANWSNPFGVTTDDFRGAETICSGAGARDFANISNIYVGCGLLRGPPRRTDGNDPDSALFENHSKWSSPLYSCATAMRAVVKTVSFTVNGTDGLNSLSVDSIKPKEYASPDDHPLWALEDSGLAMDGISPIWGIISPEYASRPNISTVKQPAFHLPGYSSSLLRSSLQPPLGVMRYNLAGSDFPSEVMRTLFASGLATGVLGVEWPFDLAGAASMTILRRWQTLARDPRSAADIIKLLWTDVAASAVVGTKGALGPGNAGAADEAVPIEIRPYGRRIKYRYAFGLPAFLLLLVMGCVAGVLIVSAVLGSSTVGVLRRRMRELTVGRVLTTFLYPESGDMSMTSAAWSRANGDKAVRLGAVPQGTVAVDEGRVQSAPGTPAEEVKVGLMGDDRKPGY